MLFDAAVFVLSDPSGALAALPTYLTFAGTPLSNVRAWGEPGPFFFPQGRREKEDVVKIHSTGIYRY
jgi:hypothetical protein